MLYEVITLAMLEGSGYLARAAFVVDRLMRILGLPGKAFVPMLMGFGCSVPAVMAARTLGAERERLMTAAMAPFMSCGARLVITSYSIHYTKLYEMGMPVGRAQGSLSQIDQQVGNAGTGTQHDHPGLAGLGHNGGATAHGIGIGNTGTTKFCNGNLTQVLLLNDYWQLDPRDNYEGATRCGGKGIPARSAPPSGDSPRDSALAADSSITSLAAVSALLPLAGVRWRLAPPTGCLGNAPLLAPQGAGLFTNNCPGRQLSTLFRHMP